MVFNLFDMWLLRSKNKDMMLGSTVFNYNYQCTCCLYTFVCVHPLQGTLEGVGPVNQQFFYTPEWQRAKRMPFGPKKVEIYLLCTKVPEASLTYPPPPIQPFLQNNLEINSGMESA